MAAMRYKLGGITLAPLTANRVEILPLTSTLTTTQYWVPLQPYGSIRMRAFPISRETGAAPVYVRLAMAGRLLHNTSDAVEVRVQVMDGSNLLVELYSPGGGQTPLFPISVCRTHQIAEKIAVVVPPSDDPGHGSTDVEFYIRYGIHRLNQLPPKPWPVDPCGGPELDDPRAFEWSSLQVEFFTI